MDNLPKVKYAVDLSRFTSFRVGGKAEKFAEVNSTEELLNLLKNKSQDHIYLLGFGSNTLISDYGLPGLTVRIAGGEIFLDGDKIVTDAGVWWDDVVLKAIENGLWGIELMSEIPGSVGAATYINITAYGQSIGPNIEWVDVWNTDKRKIERINKDQMSWGYKSSIFQSSKNSNLIILRVCLKLARSKPDNLSYQKALDVAQELSLDPNTLEGRRRIIIEARKRAGSIWSKKTSNQPRTAGSFFRNPIVSEEQAEQVISYDESGKTREQIKLMNKVHGGNTKRVSAAHVMLAAGFKRGQKWGKVRLNDKNLLKIEATPGATAQEIYDVVKEIVNTCQEKLDIELKPEAQILGKFS